MESIIKKGSPLYHFIQWAFFPLVLVGTPYIIYLLVGPLYYLFNVVDLHRWHHSKEIQESNNNYGNNLIVFDRLFGIYFHPERQETPSRHIEEKSTELTACRAQF